MKEKISKLMNVKSLVTLILTLVFSIQTIRGYILPEQFQAVTPRTVTRAQVLAQEDVAETLAVTAWEDIRVTITAVKIVVDVITAKTVTVWTTAGRV